MNTKSNLIFSLLLLSFLTLSFGVKAQNKPNEKPKTEESKQQNSQTAEKFTAKDYEELVAKLKKGDTGVDFRKLRMAFTETKEYSYDGFNREEKAKIFKPLQEKNYKEALKAAEKILDKNYTEINAHYVAAVANQELKNTEKFEFHKKIYLGLINSIMRGYDGKSAKTSFEVITIDEEYSVINALGYQRGSQALVKQDGSTYDVLTVTNPKNNETLKIYFNIDVVWKAETKLFGK